MKISKKNLMSFARNHAYGEELLVTMKYGIITEAFILYK